MDPDCGGYSHEDEDYCYELLPKPRHETYDVEIFGFDGNHKIAAIKFIRSVTAARNQGEPLGLKEAKKAIDMLEASEVPKLVISNVPTYLQGLVNQAAKDSLVNIVEETKSTLPFYL